jgi:uncharacterized protein (DUF433 family)
MKTETIEIVDRGRGLQLSTNRITVQDLVPYFQDGCSHQEILRWMPSLSGEEIAVVEQYYRAHQPALDEEDRQIKARHAQNRNPAWVEKVMQEARQERLARAKSPGNKPNGDAP